MSFSRELPPYIAIAGTSMGNRLIFLKMLLAALEEASGMPLHQSIDHGAGVSGSGIVLATSLVPLLGRGHQEPLPTGRSLKDYPSVIEEILQTDWKRAIRERAFFYPGSHIHGVFSRIFGKAVMGDAYADLSIVARAGSIFHDRSGINYVMKSYDPATEDISVAKAVSGTMSMPYAMSRQYTEAGLKLSDGGLTMPSTLDLVLERAKEKAQPGQKIFIIMVTPGYELGFPPASWFAGRRSPTLVINDSVKKFHKLKQEGKIDGFVIDTPFRLKNKKISNDAFQGNPESIRLITAVAQKIIEDYKHEIYRFGQLARRKEDILSARYLDFLI